MQITKHKFSKDALPLVSICSITYNHENYIRDTIEGFLMQDTTFPFEILINDDASPDKTADIIKEYEEKYPSLIFPVYQKENQRSKGVRPNPTFNYPRARGKYIALCEGDDYWTDPYKLQKQVDFLEENPEYIGVVHNTQIELLNGKKIAKGEFTPKDNIRKKDLYKGWQFHINSLMFRNINDKMESWNRDVFIDVALGIMLRDIGKIGSIPESMSVYRKHDTGQTGIMSNDRKRYFNAEMRWLNALKSELKGKLGWGYYYMKARIFEKHLLVDDSLFKNATFLKVKYWVILTFLTGIYYPRNFKTRLRVIKKYLNK